MKAMDEEEEEEEELRMKAMDEEEGKKTVTIRVRSKDEEGRKRVAKSELKSLNTDTIKYIEKKLWDKGLQRLERHPADGLGLANVPPKSGHGGNYTWEGPTDVMYNELKPARPAIDEKDPNYVDEEEERILRGEKSKVAWLVVGEVEVAKVAQANEGVARVDVDPHLKFD